jgi:hypothetical protein
MMFSAMTPSLTSNITLDKSNLPSKTVFLKDSTVYKPKATLKRKIGKLKRILSRILPPL